MLTDTEKTKFKRNGFIVLSDALDSNLVSEMRTIYENDSLPDDRAKLREIDSNPSAADFEYDDRLSKVMYDRTLIVSPPTEEPFREINEQICEYARELVTPGLETTLRTTQFVHRLPSEDRLVDPAAKQPSEIDEQSHIDGIENRTRRRPFPIGAAVYVDEVQPRGGGFTVWPGSHWHVADFFRNHDPKEAVDSVPAPTADGWDYDSALRSTFDPFEISGEAGTVVLWHGHILHSGGVNPSPGTVRKELISRFDFPEEEVPEDYLHDPFAGWNIADASPDLSRANTLDADQVTSD